MSTNHLISGYPPLSTLGGLQLVNDRQLTNGSWHDTKLPYSGKLSREKTFTNRWNIRFCGKNFRGFTTDRILCAINQSRPHSFSRRKLSQMASNPRNSWNFSLSKVSRYTVPHPYHPETQGKNKRTWKSTVKTSVSWRWVHVLDGIPDKMGARSTRATLAKSTHTSPFRIVFETLEIRIGCTHINASYSQPLTSGMLFDSSNRHMQCTCAHSKSTSTMALYACWHAAGTSEYMYIVHHRGCDVTPTKV